MNINTKFNILMHKAYFDTGWSFWSMLRYVIVLTGLAEGFATSSLKYTLMIGFVYGIFCYAFGFVWFKYGWINAQHEVANRYNEFMKELRRNKVLKGNSAL